jgi:hypothetical protein
VTNALTDGQAYLMASSSPHLAVLVDGGTEVLLRPHRALSDIEAFAMCGAWAHAYRDLLQCPHSQTVDCACPDECVPDYRSERVVAETIGKLMRPLQ